MTAALDTAAAPYTLLLVDDSPVNLELVVESLEHEGYEVLVALDGEEALERAERVRPDLILLDVMMPGIDGFETCRRLKETPATAEIPVIFMTSLSAMRDKVEGFAAGAVDYLTKPLHIDEVRARVGAHLRLRTLHRQLEEKNAALARREEEFRTLVENADDVVVRYDRECARLYVNRAWERVNGLAREEVLGKRPGERSGRVAATAARFEAMLRRVMEHGRGENYELSWTDERGEPVYFDLRAHPESDADGTVTSVLTVARDVTARRRAEEALRHSHRRLEEAQRIGRVGHWELNLESGRLEWSDEVFRIFEIDPERFGASYEAFIATVHPEDRERVDRAYHDSLERRAPYQIEHRLLLPDGRIKYVAEHCESWFDNAGRPLRSLGTVHDITPLKEAEERLRRLSTHREALREAERKRIAWQMHEELGQYLTAIRLGLGTLRGSFAPDAPGLDGETRALTDLLDHTLRIVRDVVGELRPPVLDHGIAPALEWLADDFSRRTGLPCGLRQTGEPPPLDEGRALALFRAAEEALENVVRHAAPRRADLTVEWREDRCRLTVADDGRGFDPATTDHRPLGLLGIEARLAVFGGRLEVAGAVGEGTVVTATLPLNAPTANPSESSDETPAVPLHRPSGAEDRR